LKRIIASLAWIFAITLACSGQATSSYLPQVAAGVASGIAWHTYVVVTNPAAVGTSDSNVTITFTKSDGTPFNIVGLFTNEMGDLVGIGNVISFQISGGQTRFLVMDDQLAAVTPLAVGFATVTSSAPVTATGVFDASYVGGPGSRELGQAGVTAAVLLSRQSIIAVKNSEHGVVQVSTAVAFANPNSTAATVTFELLDTSGVTPFASVTRTLPPNNHTAIFVTELFPSLPANFWGTMHVTTSAQTPIVATTLLFDHNGGFAAFPIVPLP